VQHVGPLVGRVQAGPGHARDVGFGRRRVGADQLAVLDRIGHVPGQELDHPLAQASVRFGGLPASDQVACLHRVVREVEQQLAVAQRGVDILVVALDQAEVLGAGHVHGVALGLARRLIQQVQAVDPLGLVNARPVQAGRHDVGQAHQPITGGLLHRVGRPVAGRRADEHRDVGAALERGALGPHAVVAEHLAVVGREDDPRVVQQPHLAQPAEEDAQVVIDLADAGVVRTPGRGDLLGPEAVHGVEGVRRLHHAARHRVGVAGPVAPHRLGHGHAVVELPVLGVAVPRRVGLGEAGPHEKRPRRVARLQEVDRPVHRPVREAQRLGHGGHGRLHLVLPDAVVHRAVVRAQPVEPAVVVFKDLHVLEAVVAPRRGEVHLADGAGLVAVVGEHARERGVLLHGPDRAAVAGQAVGVAVPAGHDGVACGHADRAVRVAAGVADPLAGQPVEVRGKDAAVAVPGDRVEALLVGGDQDDVRAVGHGRRCRLMG